MGAEIPTGYGQAAVKFTCSGVIDAIVTTFGYACGASGSPTADQNANTIMDKLTNTTTKLFSAQQFSSDYILTGVSVNENHGSGPVIGQSSSPAVPGIATSASLPPNCAFLVRKGTALGGRRGRGRMYLPPVFTSEAGVAANGQITGSMSSTQTRLNLLLTDLTAASLPMVLLHGYTLDADGEPVPGQTLPDPSPVTSLVLQMLIASQRRRLR